MELTQQENFLTQQGYSTSTIEYYHAILTALASITGPDLNNLTATQLHQFLSTRNWSNASQWGALCAIKAYLRWMHGDTHIALTYRLKRLESPPQRVLNAAQVHDLIHHFPPTIKGNRDKSMCALFLDSGLRCAEMCNLELRNLDLTERNLKVRIKGGKTGSGVYSTTTALLLAAWLPEREKIQHSRKLFVNMHTGASMTRWGIKHIVGDWGRESGIGPLSPHDLRRTFATLSIRLGASTRIVQAAGRWSSLAMVERYAQINASDLEGFFVAERCT
jgi:site-specific recombinase XerD